MFEFINNTHITLFVNSTRCILELTNKAIRVLFIHSNIIIQI